MRNVRKYWWLAAAAALVGAGLLKDSLAQGVRTPAAPAKVAVCDVVKVFNEYKKVQKLYSEAQQKDRDMKAQEDRRVQMINDLAAELKQLVEGQPDYETRVEELLRRRNDLEVWKKTNEQLLMKWHFQATRQMFADILAVVKRIAQERGYDLVLFKEADTLQAANTNELLEEIGARRKVLYSDPSLDITQDVTDRVNLEYKPIN